MTTISPDYRPGKAATFNLVWLTNRWSAAVILMLIGFSAASFSQTVNQSPLSRDQLKLIDKGFSLFTTETFNGNGRTCATCHIPEKNYNITPADIAELSTEQKNLVLAKNVPELENSTLVRKLALFNINEEHSPGNSAAAVGPFRASMTIAGLGFTTDNQFCTVPAGLTTLTGCAQSAAVEPVNDGSRRIEIGWSGDGAILHTDVFPDIPEGAACRAAVSAFNANPADLNLALRVFALAAVKTHDTRSLNRIPGTDFRCPTAEELDALAAFQQWLGRRFELDLSRVTFKKGYRETGPGTGLTEEGKAIFMSDMATCNRCHVNGGANGSLGRVLLPENAPPSPPSPPIPGANKNSHTSVDLLRISEVFLDTLVSPVLIPPDRGDRVLKGGIQADGSRAGGFNMQSLIEAPRKKAFFHNNGFTNSVEDASRFYFTNTFDQSQAGAGRVRGVFRGGLSGPEALAALGGTTALNKMGLFLRSLSAVYSLADCERLVTEMLFRLESRLPMDVPFRHCQFALQDVRTVLNSAKVKSNPYFQVPELAQYLEDYLVAVMNPTNQYQISQRPKYLQEIIEELRWARNLIATTPELP